MEKRKAASSPPGSPTQHIKTHYSSAEHTHPHNRRFSSQDLSGRAHWYPTRFVDKNSGQVFDRKLLMFFKEPMGGCSAYNYNNYSRTISALRRGEWIPIAKVDDKWGSVNMLDGQDWLPRQEHE
ncbi:hypothetical protein [Melittangium boletus]|uniref:hypothetical protein n=1 Tax=Melittangium boletus TaxID=83453 RepID=UPI0012FDB184|nr:hypothetical protein [Melittangium boletus]